MRRGLWPVTERILAHLPGPRLLWIVAWACIPWLNAGANLLLDTGARSAIWEQNGTLVILNYVSLSLAVVIAVWGTARLTRRIEALPTVSTSSSGSHADEHFREINSAVGPLVASAATAIAFALSTLFADGWTSAILRGTTWFLVGIALWTFLWTYVWLQVGLDRLGRERLITDANRVDRSLGLRPLGDLAFMALWMLLAWLVPLVLTGLPDIVGVSLGAAVLGAALGALFLSLLRLHRQMVEVKAAEIEIARGLYREAYEPLREGATLEALERQRALLGAADALEQRAAAIHEWPISEGNVARVVTITTSVIAVALARLLLSPLGL